MVYTWRYLDEWINEALGSAEKEFSHRWKRIDDTDTWKISFVIPGVKREEIEITSSNGWARIKYPNASFRVSLPKELDHETLQAKLDLGILELTVSESRSSGMKTIKVQ